MQHCARIQAVVYCTDIRVMQIRRLANHSAACDMSCRQTQMPSLYIPALHGISLQHLHSKDFTSLLFSHILLDLVFTSNLLQRDIALRKLGSP